MLMLCKPLSAVNCLDSIGFSESIDVVTTVYEAHIVGSRLSVIPTHVIYQYRILVVQYCSHRLYLQSSLLYHALMRL